MKNVVNYADKYLADEFYNGLGSQWDLQMQKVEARAEKAGMKANQIATAKRMLADGLNLEKTSKYTGLSIKVLEKLKIN